MNKLLILTSLILGCANGNVGTSEDAGEEYIYPSFTSVCQLDNGLGVECSNLTPDQWAWSWMGTGDTGLQSFYCNVKPCSVKKQCTVQSQGQLLTGVCQ